MTPRKAQPPRTEPKLPPERAYPALRKQLDSLQALMCADYREGYAAEQEWYDVTKRVIEMAFGAPSTALDSFHTAHSAGNYRIMLPEEPEPHQENQHNFQMRIAAYDGSLRASISALELSMPEGEIKGHYEVGEEYEFYRDIKAILSLTKTDVLVIDPYLDEQIFSNYADGIDRSIKLRVLSNRISPTAMSVAAKYAAGGNLSLRTTTEIHDRLIIIDDRVWCIGQSIKDAAKKKPTYIVEQDATNVRPTYESIWGRATPIH